MVDFSKNYAITITVRFHRDSHKHQQNPQTDLDEKIILYASQEKSKTSPSLSPLSKVLLRNLLILYIHLAWIFKRMWELSIQILW